MLQTKAEEEMEVWWRSRKWEQIRVFFLILLLHGVAILIFTRGFLLTRTELPFYSHCSDLSQSPCFSSSSSSSSPNSSHCWTKPVVDRVVIIVLDALRFDFVAPSTFFEVSKPWMDKLRVIQKLASERGSSARIFKAIADPPTTSLQRLKGLTTGGLPTFIDVGNSFGAPAIVEDNFIHQLVQNGKRVVMMGDDTWTQLFPNHFKKSYPYPSFNVKDLHTVDNGCIEHLLPTLYQDDWDVLIAHFLGVDHAGHIFGVDSGPMIEKLEQYNLVLEKVIEVLESQSGPGGLHENTFLLVMGDHGQTLHGDHGGGSPEEVETSIFAMNFKKSPFSIPPEFDTSSGGHNLLDFAVTLSSLLGVPFPFGSIGRVNADLYALGSGTLNSEGTNLEKCQNQSELEQWKQNYVNVLCINSWQVKRYIDVYSASSLIGFSHEDLLQIADVYAQAEKSWSNTTKKLFLDQNECSDSLLPALKMQVDLYVNFLTSVAELARSKWTEFNLKMMGTGFGIMLVSLLIHLLSIKWVAKQYGASFTCGDSGISLGLIVACFVVVIRASSFLSNSYILEEGKVANFLLATTGIFKLRYAILRKKMLLEAVVFLLLITFCRFTIEIGLSKQAVTSQFLNAYPSWMMSMVSQFPAWMYIAEVVPMLVVILLSYLLYKTISNSCFVGIWKYVIMGTILSYMLIAVHWASESGTWSLALVSYGIGRNCIPRMIYGIGLGQLSLLAFSQLFNKDKGLDRSKSLVVKTVGMLSALSSVVILLSGKQGPLVALASIIGGCCIMRLGNMENEAKDSMSDPLPVIQWNLLAACMFFCTGHWCAFDGLRYGAAFIGFDEFILIRQAIFLTIDTFGFSHILPIFALPFLVARQNMLSQKQFILMRLSQVYLTYGLITATTVTVTMLCVTIHRRHLMVWGLFAPKFVFDIVGLILTDVFICLASLFYFGRVEKEVLQNPSTEK
ncbi:GPI ethanolamine phosphate transferase 3 isoform X2 [Juglans microcarpa x Juglans regia]|uniref:GPI ethanolamine phosphate transferase 3 isoform X2 n=1 Tax=Juglans microcarpa x Juglans regia TaxID=2249226 RepID=UPI001B7E1A6B|nr:GPI ethanolamine phosphate transferase 3 isoform X2 [Juglans microcarpa x Juglans regia]